MYLGVCAVRSIQDVQIFYHQTFNHPTLNHDRVRGRVRARVIDSNPLAMSLCYKVYIIKCLVINSRVMKRRVMKCR